LYTKIITQNYKWKNVVPSLCLNKLAWMTSFEFDVIYSRINAMIILCISNTHTQYLSQTCYEYSTMIGFCYPTCYPIHGVWVFWYEVKCTPVHCELLSVPAVDGVAVDYSAKLYLFCVFAGSYLYNTDTVSRNASIAVGVIAIVAIVLNIVQLVYLCRKSTNTQSGECLLLFHYFPFSNILLLLLVFSHCSANGCLQFNPSAPSTVGICMFPKLLHIEAY